MACDARRCNDEMQCGRCGLAWELNDADRPACRPEVDRRRGMRARKAAPLVVELALSDLEANFTPDDARRAVAEYNASYAAGGETEYPHWADRLLKREGA